MKGATAELRAALRVRYPVDEYALLFEVGKSTGFSNDGWADAIAMSLWPSRGLRLHGFEIKAYRGDWLRELKKPAKAEDFCSMCDHWTIVAAAGAVKPEEVPPTWGLLEHRGGKLHPVVPAPLLAGCGDTFKRSFVAAMLRRASQADAGEVEAAIAKQLEKAAAGRDEEIKRLVDRRTRAATELLKKAEEIKAITGIDLQGWTPSDEIGAAIKAVLNGGVFSNYRGLATLAEQLEKQAAELRAAMGVVQPSPPAFALRSKDRA